MELLRRLNREQGLTVVMVLHELNQAARYSDQWPYFMKVIWQLWAVLKRS